MNAKTIFKSEFIAFIIFAINILLFFPNATAQLNRAVDGEMAVCTIRVNNKVFTLTPDQLGSFDKISNIRPLQTVPIEVYYPTAERGEKVVLSIIDGGEFEDGKAVKVLQLNTAKKISFNFQTSSSPGIYQIELQKGQDSKVVQLWVDEENNQGNLINAENGGGNDGGKSCGNNNSHGKQQNAKDCKKTGDPFVPFTGNESRNVKDLQIWGAVGEAEFVWERYGNSRAANSKRLLGDGSNWNHSFKYEMTDAGKDVKGQPQIFVHYPEGGEDYFTKSATNVNLWLPLPGAGSRLFQNADTFILQKEDGFRYHLEKLSDNSGKKYYQLQSYLDSYQNKYTLNYDSLRRLSKITEPAGRYFHIIYGRKNGKDIITQVNTNDGRSVKYHYTIFKDSITNWVVLDSVFYGDGTAARYTYSQRKPGSRPSLEHAIDPRYTGTDVNMKYTYDTMTTILGFIKQEKNGLTGEVMTTLIDEEIKRKVCYANGRVEIFNVPINMQGKITSYVDGLGRVTKNAFSDGGKSSFPYSQTDALSRTTIYNKRTIYGNLLEITYPDGSKEKWTRNSLDLVLTHTDELGRVTAYKRDSKHRVIRIDYPDKTFETFTYNNFGEVLHHQRRNGGLEIFAYDSRGLRTRFTDAFGNVTGYGYDNSDRPASITDALGRTSESIYNEIGLITTMTNPDGSFKTYSYDEFGNRTTITDELGHSWVTQYDEFKRPVTVTDPLKRVTKYEYDLPGGICGCTHEENKPTKITSPSGKVTTIEYDVEWQKIEETVGAGTPDEATTFYEYNLVGKLADIVDPREKEWKTEYDERDRRIASTDPLGNKTGYSYDSVGNIAKVTRPNGGMTVNFYDNMNRDTMAVDPKGQVTKMAYDAEGNMIQLTDPKNNIYRFKYDQLNRKTKMIYPDSLFESYTYDSVSNLKTYKTRAGQVRTYVYDNRNREIFSSWKSPYLNDNTPSITRTYDNAGRLLTMISSVSSLSYKYDDANELVSETQDVLGGNRGKTILYSYTKDGLRKTITYPDGTVINYAYTGRNQMRTISPNSKVLSKYTYDLNGNRISKTLENGTHTDYTYDDANRVLSIDNLKGTSSFARFDYGYDNVDRRTFVKRDSDKGDVYSYDATDQVTGVLYNVTNPDVAPSSPDRTVNYGYDSLGNRTTVSENGSPTTYATNYMNQYTNVGSDSLTYYRNANLKTFNGWTYSYDAQNRLINAQKGNAINSFTYDPQNRCVMRTINGTITFFYYDNWNLIEERNIADSEIAEYVNGAQTDEILKKKKTTKLSDLYYHFDAIGSVTQLTDKSGNVVEKYSYDIFGTPTIKDRNGTVISGSSVDNRFMFTGREYIRVLNAYDYRNRMYSSVIGKFFQTDPLRFGSSDYNLYRYVKNSSISFNDPEGLQSKAGGDCYDLSVSQVTECAAEIISHDGDCSGWVLFFGPGKICDGFKNKKEEPHHVTQQCEAPCKCGNIKKINKKGESQTNTGDIYLDKDNNRFSEKTSKTVCHLVVKVTLTGNITGTQGTCK